MSRISKSPILKLIAYLFAICSFGYGVNAILNPVFALSFFGFDYPRQFEPNKSAIDALMLIYGIRDIYMGLAMLAAAYYGHSEIMGWLTLATGGIAVSDGAICYYIAGTGQWNHWTLSPVIFIVAAAFLGAFDGA